MLTYASNVCLSGKLYAREDHLRTLEELEDSKAQLVELNEGLASLQHQVTLRSTPPALLTKPLPLPTKPPPLLTKTLPQVTRFLGYH